MEVGRRWLAAIIAIGLAVVLIGLGAVVAPGAVSDLPGIGDGALEERWISPTARAVEGNHHAPVGGIIDSEPVVFAPISGEGNSRHCALVALSGRNGSVQWRRSMPPLDCTIHSVADPTLADVDDDGTPEVLAATTAEEVAAYDGRTGDVVFRHDLSSYGYTRPLVANVTGDGRSEILVADVKGAVFAVRPNGTTIWTRRLGAFVWSQPAVADFDADGAPELVVALASGDLSLLDAETGETRWNRSVPVNRTITWTTTGQADDDPAIEIVAATAGGEVLAFDGAGGDIEWQVDFGAFAAVDAIGDGDGDGQPEVYVAARDGKLRSIDAATGSVEWTTVLTDADVQMGPPPAMGDVDGDGDPELVAPSNDGRVAIVDPATGEILSSARRDVSIWTRPTLADLDGDGIPEILVMYGNGQVVALSTPPADASSDT